MISVLFLINLNSILAYIDPGLGSAIAGSIWPLIIAFFSSIFVFILKYFWNPIKKGFSKLRKER